MHIYKFLIKMYKYYIKKKNIMYHISKNKYCR